MDFIKACWHDFITRMSFRLSKHRLIRSQFRWVESNHIGATRTCIYHLDQLPIHDITRSEGREEPGELYRQLFRIGLGWVPYYLDSRPGFDTSTIPHSFKSITIPGNRRIAKAVNWANSAWRAQKESNAPGMIDMDRQILNPNHGEELYFEDFKYIHLMVFLPKEQQQVKEETYSHYVKDLSHRFGIGNSTGRNVSITWLPSRQEKNAFKHWRYDCRENSGIEIFRERSPITGNRLAGQLVGIWLDQLIKEIWNV
jgi:hypothetical protein